MRIGNPICILFALLVPCFADSLTHFDCENGGNRCFAQVARDFSMGGTLQSDLIREDPVLKMSFCITHHPNSPSSGNDSFSLWSIPYFSLCFPVRNSILGFHRNCLYDYNYRLATSTRVLISSGALWDNSIWWRHRLLARVSLNLEAGILTGKIVDLRGSNSHHFLRERRVGGRILGSSITVTQTRCETYGGLRYYLGDEQSPDVWVGCRREISPVRNGRLEVAYRPSNYSIRRNSNFPEFHFGIEEKISEVWLRYGFATLLSPALFCVMVGCGLSDEILNVDIAIGSHFFENETMVKLLITLTTKL